MLVMVAANSIGARKQFITPKGIFPYRCVATASGAPPLLSPCVVAFKSRESLSLYISEPLRTVSEWCDITRSC